MEISNCTQQDKKMGWEWGREAVRAEEEWGMHTKVVFIFLATFRSDSFISLPYKFLISLFPKKNPSIQFASHKTFKLIAALHIFQTEKTHSLIGSLEVLTIRDITGAHYSFMHCIY